MIELTPNVGGAVGSAIQFDAVSVADAITASTITVTSAVTASLLVVQNLASINSLIVSSLASVSRLVASSNIQAVIGSFNRLAVASNIQVVIGSFNRIEVASNIIAVTGSFSANLVVGGSFSVTGVSQFSAASFSDSIQIGGSIVAIDHKLLIKLATNAIYVMKAVQTNNTQICDIFLNVNNGAEFYFRDSLGSARVALKASSDSFILSNLGIGTDAPSVLFAVAGIIGIASTGGYIDLSGIAAGNPNLKITATSDTPSTVFSTSTGFNQLPDGYMEMNKGGSAVYVPFFR